MPKMESMPGRSGSSFPSSSFSITLKRRVQRIFIVGAQASWQAYCFLPKVLHEVCEFLFFFGGHLPVRLQRYQTSMTYLAMFQSFSIDKQYFYWTA